MNCPSTIGELDEIITRPTEQVRAAIELCPGPITVLGAAGKMGFHLCLMLKRVLSQLDREHDLVAVSRFSTANSLIPFQEAKIRTLVADLSESEQIDTIPVTPWVFFLAGIKFGTADNPALLDRMNSQMPKLVAARFANSSIVAMSTGCVYSFTTPGTGGSKESDPTDPPGVYAQSCLDRETAFIEGSLSHHTRCVLIRLNYSIDLRYGVLVDIAQQVLTNTPINIETGFANVIWQGDAIQQILRSPPLADSPPFVLNVTGSNTLRVRELALAFGKRLNRSPTFSGTESNNCWLSNNSLARNLFGEPATDLEQMMDWISHWLLSGGPSLNKPTHFQTRDGKY